MSSPDTDFIRVREDALVTTQVGGAGVKMRVDPVEVTQAKRSDAILIAERGPRGTQGVDGADGADGADGVAAYNYVQDEDPDITEGGPVPIGTFWAKTDEIDDIREVPPHTVVDVGKALIVIDGVTYAWTPLPDGLPEGAEDGDALLWVDGVPVWGTLDALPAGSAGKKIVHDGTGWVAVGSSPMSFRISNDPPVNSGAVPAAPTLIPGMEITNIPGNRTVLVSAGLVYSGHVNRHSLWVDGVKVYPPGSPDGIGMMNSADTGMLNFSVADIPVVLGAGLHTVQVRWAAQGSTGAVNLYERHMVVKDLL